MIEQILKYRTSFFVRFEKELKAIINGQNTEYGSVIYYQSKLGCKSDDGCCGDHGCCDDWGCCSHEDFPP